MEHAATLATSGLTAFQALRDVTKVQRGQSVLITGASGGVGSSAVQIAKRMGAKVTGVCSTRSVEMVRALGAGHVIETCEGDFTHSGRRSDVILDKVEAQPLADARRALALRGTLIPSSGKGSRWFGPLGRILAAHGRSSLAAVREGALVVAQAIRAADTGDGSRGDDGPAATHARDGGPRQAELGVDGDCHGAVGQSWRASDA